MNFVAAMTGQSARGLAKLAEPDGGDAAKQVENLVEDFR
jgi:hypothetical protein